MDFPTTSHWIPNSTPRNSQTVHPLQLRGSCITILSLNQLYPSNQDIIPYPRFFFDFSQWNHIANLWGCWSPISRHTNSKNMSVMYPIVCHWYSIKSLRHFISLWVPTNSHHGYIPFKSNLRPCKHTKICGKPTWMQIIFENRRVFHVLWHVYPIFERVSPCPPFWSSLPHPPRQGTWILSLHHLALSAYVWSTRFCASTKDGEVVDHQVFVAWHVRWRVVARMAQG